MKWFLIVMTIHNGNTPKFHASSMPDYNRCIGAVRAAKIKTDKGDGYGNAVAIYCASEPPSKSLWTFNGKLWFSVPRQNK